MDHKWPNAQNWHKWSRWMTKDINTKYSQCIHPHCDAYEEKDAKEIRNDED